MIINTFLLSNSAKVSPTPKCTFIWTFFHSNGKQWEKCSDGTISLHGYSNTPGLAGDGPSRLGHFLGASVKVRRAIQNVGRTTPCSWAPGMNKMVSKLSTNVHHSLHPDCDEVGWAASFSASLTVLAWETVFSWCEPEQIPPLGLCQLFCFSIEKSNKHRK